MTEPDIPTASSAYDPITGVTVTATLSGFGVMTLTCSVCGDMGQWWIGLSHFSIESVHVIAMHLTHVHPREGMGA